MIDETLAFLRLVKEPGDIVELRGLSNSGKIFSGRFNDMALFARNAHALQQKRLSESIFLTINSLKPEAKHVGATEVNKIARNTKRTSGDRDILARRVYVIDVDSVRPKGLCATEAERAEALKVAVAVVQFLRDQHGWAEPLIVDSGNGFHAYFKASGGNPEQPAWPFVLKKLSAMFSTPGATVDASVGNSARIMRLVGTLNQKGPNTSDRPHRRCRTHSQPEEFMALPSWAAYNLACKLGYEDVPTRKTQTGDRPPLVDDPGQAIANFIAEFPGVLELSHVYERNGDVYWALKTCPFAGRQHRGFTGKTAIRLTDSAVGFVCLSDDCTGLGMQDLRRLLHKQTGRWPKIQFYEARKKECSSWEERELDEEQKSIQSAMRFRADIMYDRVTYNNLVAGMMIEDPAYYGLDFLTLFRPFMAWATRKADDMSNAVEAEDLLDRCKHVEDERDMGRILGPETLYEMFREMTRPPEAGLPWWKQEEGWKEDEPEPVRYTGDLSML